MVYKGVGLTSMFVIKGRSVSTGVTVALCICVHDKIQYPSCLTSEAFSFVVTVIVPVESTSTQVHTFISVIPKDLYVLLT